MATFMGQIFRGSKLFDFQTFSVKKYVGGQILLGSNFFRLEIWRHAIFWGGQKTCRQNLSAVKKFGGQNFGS